MKCKEDESMRIDTFAFTGSGGEKLPAIIWLPDGEPRRILQITHGILCWMSMRAARQMKRFG